MNAFYPKLDAGEDCQSWVPVLELATREVFALMLQSSLADASQLFDENELAITAIVGLAGCVSGAVSLRCSPASAALMAAKMLGVSSVEAAPEVQDAVGEVCNMIAGNFKNKIAGMGDGCLLSVPTVITGTDYNLHSLACFPRIEIHLYFADLPLIVSLTVHSWPSSGPIAD